MKILLPLRVLICSLLLFAAPSSACNTFPDTQIVKVPAVDEAVRSATIRDAETGDPFTFVVDATVSIERKVLLNAEFDGLLELDIQARDHIIFVRYQIENDELLATEIERWN